MDPDITAKTSPRSASSSYNLALFTTSSSSTSAPTFNITILAANLGLLRPEAPSALADNQASSSSSSYLSHCLQGLLDSASALVCLLPARCSILYEYSSSLSNQRACCPIGSGVSFSHRNAL